MLWAMAKCITRNSNINNAIHKIKTGIIMTPSIAEKHNLKFEFGSSEKKRSAHIRMRRVQSQHRIAPKPSDITVTLPQYYCNRKFLIRTVHLRLFIFMPSKVWFFNECMPVHKISYNKNNNGLIMLNYFYLIKSSIPIQVCWVCGSY
jgi:hypothetical protein